jgi:hypothetical protein
VGRSGRPPRVHHKAMPGAACSLADPGTGYRELQGPDNSVPSPGSLGLRSAAKNRGGRSQGRAAYRKREPHWKAVRNKGWWAPRSRRRWHPPSYLRCRGRQDCSQASAPARWRDLGKAGQRSPWGLELAGSWQDMVRTPRARRPRRTSVWKFSPDLSPEPMRRVGNISHQWWPATTHLDRRALQ